MKDKNAGRKKESKNKKPAMKKDVFTRIPEFLYLYLKKKYPDVSRGIRELIEKDYLLHIKHKDVVVK